MKTKRPLFKDMSDQALIEAYWDERGLATNWDGIAKAAPRASRRTRSRVASGVLRSLRNIDIIVAVARKRGLRLARPEDA